jgi:hypothetical protein
MIVRFGFAIPDDLEADWQVIGDEGPSSHGTSLPFPTKVHWNRVGSLSATQLGQDLIQLGRCVCIAASDDHVGEFNVSISTIAQIPSK